MFTSEVLAIVRRQLEWNLQQLTTSLARITEMDINSIKMLT